MKFELIYRLGAHSKILHCIHISETAAILALHIFYVFVIKFYTAVVQDLVKGPQLGYLVLVFSQKAANLPERNDNPLN